MNRETVSSLFALFSGASADEYMPLISAAVAETEAALREGADKTDIRLCYLAAGLANLRYTTILWARSKPEATYAGNIARSINGAPEVGFANRLVEAYRAMCADLLLDRAFVFRTIGEVPDEGAV